MKTIEYYLTLPYKLEITPDPDEGGFAVSYPDLPGCISCGKTMEQAIANAEDAKKVWLEAAMEDGIEIAEPNCKMSSSYAEFKKELLEDPEVKAAYDELQQEYDIMQATIDVEKRQRMSITNTISARTPADMDKAVSNFKAGTVSSAIDLSDFV